MRIVATTVIRHVPPTRCSGRLLTIDVDRELDRIVVVADHRLPENRFRSVDPNRRGGTRGLRCVAWRDGNYLVTDSTGVSTVNPSSGAVTCRIEHPMLSGTHTVAPDGDGIWLVSAHADTVIRLDDSGCETARWRPTESAVLTELLAPPTPVDPGHLADFRDPSVLVEHTHDVTHMNSLVVDGDSLVISLGNVLTAHPAAAAPMTADEPVAFRADSWQQAPGTWRHAHAIVRVPLNQGREPAGEPDVLWLGPAQHFPNHDVLLADSSLWFNDSNSNRICQVRDGRLVSGITVAGQFLRGMAICADSQVVVGTQAPLALHMVDLVTERVTGTWQVPGADGESFTWLAPVPQGGSR